MASFGKDNVTDEHRALFEELFEDFQKTLLQAMINQELPNAYLETMLARMVAMRSAACDEDIPIVLARVETMSRSFAEASSVYAQARQHGRDIRRRNRNSREDLH